jgi:hypothetical protein
LGAGGVAELLGDAGTNVCVMFVGHGTSNDASASGPYIAASIRSAWRTSIARISAPPIKTPTDCCAQ